MQINHELYMDAKNCIDEAISIIQNNDGNISDLINMASSLGGNFEKKEEFINLCGAFRNLGSSIYAMQDKITRCSTAMASLVNAGIIVWNENGSNDYLFDENLKTISMTQEEFLSLIVDGIQNGVNKDLIVSKYGNDIYALVQKNVDANIYSTNGILDVSEVKILDDGGYLFNASNNNTNIDMNTFNAIGLNATTGILSVLGIGTNVSGVVSPLSSSESVSNIDATLSSPVQTGTISKDETKTGTIEKEEDRTFPSSPKPNYTYIYDGYEERGDLADNRDYIIGYLKRKGIDDKYIAGILSNIEAESNFNPGKQNPSGAYGLCQWTGTRKNDLENFCANNGYNTDEIEGQLEFMIHELNGKEKEALGKMYEADTAYDAGRAFSVYYERHGISSQNHTRANNAAQNLEYVQSFGTETTRL